jgi:deoxyhypusine synthase
MKKNNDIKNFLEKNFKHYNAKTMIDASKEWVNQLKSNNKMFLSIAGAMSTAEIGISLAEMIRKNKIHAISCTGANLEEDIFNLIANKDYIQVPNWRYLTPEQENDFEKRGFSRITDTCIPEDKAMKKIESKILNLWNLAEKKNKRYFPHDYIYQLLLSGELEKDYQIDPKNSWVLAAAQKNIPIFVPGWEDSTLGNAFVANKINNKINNLNIVKNGMEQMQKLIHWYLDNSKLNSIGFFQIGGGIAGDFPICVVPLINKDLLSKKTKLWSYFCQISDSTTSYGSYSGANPNEKITWGKLSPHSPKFIIESDATIVAPLVFLYVLSS